MAWVLLIFGMQIFAQNDAQDQNPPEQNQEERQDALQLYRNRQYAAAIRVTEQEVTADPQNMDAYTVMGWSLLALRRYDQAIEWMQKARNVNGFDSRIVYILAEAQYALSNFAQMIEEGIRYLRLTPNGSYIDQIHYFMGISYRELGYTKKAEISLSAATYYNDSAASWWEQLGLLRELLDDDTGAIEAFEQSLSLDGTRGIAQEALARLQVQRN